jgi:hypothetical protein
MRPYKPALSTVEAHALMHRQRDQFDADWLAFFVRVIGLYPVGTRVRLDSGEFGVVERHGPEIDRPVVRTTTDALGNAIAAAEQRTLVIGAQERGADPLRIAEVLPRLDREPAADALARIVTSHRHACL